LSGSPPALGNTLFWVGHMLPAGRMLFRIREVREEVGMAGAVLARRAGVSKNHLYMIEHGDRTPSVALLESIARELKVEPADLLREPVPLEEAPPAGQPLPPNR
jgi:transcriptional regulator with XRE-family HTH domain